MVSPGPTCTSAPSLDVTPRPESTWMHSSKSTWRCWPRSAVAVVLPAGGISTRRNVIEAHEVGTMREHRQRLDLAAMGEAPAIVAVEIRRDVARLHGDHTHAVLAVQRFGGNRERGNVAFVPVEDEQILRAVPGGRAAG